MSQSPSSPEVQEASGFAGGLIRQARLAWRLFRDGRVPGWVKMIPFVGLIYLLSPIDLIPDWFLPGLGQMDDIAVVLLAIKMFVDLSPPGIVREHLDNLSGRRKRTVAEQDTPSGPTIDAPYTLLDEVTPMSEREPINR